MRTAIVLAAAVFLTGCADARPDPAAVPEPASTLVDPWSGAGSTLLVEGQAPWRDEAPQDMAFELAFQTVFGICVWPGGHNPDVSQFHLSERLPHDPIPNGTLAFRVKADWTDEDHLGAALRFVAINPDGDASVVDFAPRGETVDIRLPPRLPREGAWDLWLCTVAQVNPSNSQATQTAFPFLGEVSVRVEAVGPA